MRLPFAALIALALVLVAVPAHAGGYGVQAFVQAPAPAYQMTEVRTFTTVAPAYDVQTFAAPAPCYGGFGAGGCNGNFSGGFRGGRVRSFGFQAPAVVAVPVRRGPQIFGRIQAGINAFRGGF